MMQRNGQGIRTNKWLGPRLAGPVCGTSDRRQASRSPDPEMAEGGRGGRRTVVPDRGREAARVGDFADFSQSLPWAEPPVRAYAWTVALDTASRACALGQGRAD